MVCGRSHSGFSVHILRSGSCDSVDAFSCSVFGISVTDQTHGSANNQVSTNADSLVGKTVVVSEKIDNLAQSGKVNIADIEWMARSTDDLKIIPAGRKVKICSIEGVKLIVEEIKEEN